MIAHGTRSNPDPTAAIIDSQTLQSTPESGHRAGYDGAKRNKGSKIHIAIDTFDHLLSLRVTLSDEQERAHVKKIAKHVQRVTGKSVELITLIRATLARGRRRR
ncbi:MAG TPA: transposase [Tepidisphaeraceae bacterium]|nr:transposase [Tepidisphaeraceae bacterium]